VDFIIIIIIIIISIIIIIIINLFAHKTQILMYSFDIFHG